LLPCGFVSAQTFQFLPEVDSYTKLTPDIRFVFQAKETREAGDPTQAEVGPGFDFSLKPIVRLKKITVLTWMTPSLGPFSCRSVSVGSLHRTDQLLSA
jgi:hypothetical protein